MRIEGKPGKKFFRYVLPYKGASIPKKIELFEIGEKGFVDVDESKLYDFEIKRIKRRFLENEETPTQETKGKGKGKNTKKGQPEETPTPETRD
ncbi:MAG TPA: hypothetical protein PLD55_04280 [bacterium]|nr:hypothetical protein [bacterium]